MRGDESTLRRHGLDFESMTDEELWSSNAEDIRDMDSRTAGSGLYSLGSLLSGNADIAFEIDLLKAQIRQQWIIVRQNEQIIRLLRESLGKSPSSGRSTNMTEIVSTEAILVDKSLTRVGTELELDGSNLTRDGKIAAMLGNVGIESVSFALSSGGRKIIVDEVGSGKIRVGVYR